MLMPHSANQLLAKALNGALDAAPAAGSAGPGDAAGVDTRHFTDRVERDAAIQRFAYSTEACWKAAQSVLSIQFGLELGSPKSVIRSCAQNALLAETDARLAMELVDDRNLTSHTCNESLTQAIWSRLPAHLAVMQRWMAALERVTASSL